MMRKFFRCMTVDADGLPKVERSARGLGVRDVDIQPDKDGMVLPKTGGMSVAPDNWLNLPNHRRPRAFGQGSAGPSDGIYYALEATLSNGALAVRLDSKKHGLVEPAKTMPAADYIAALGATRSSWIRVVSK